MSETRREKLLAACEFDWQKEIPFELEVLWSTYDTNKVLKAGANHRNKELKPLLTALIDRVEQLEVALKFYGKKENYYTDKDGYEVTDIHYSVDAITNDLGSTANKILNGPSPLDLWLKEEE